MTAPLVVVTASAGILRAQRCIETWGDVPIVLMRNGGDRADVPAAWTGRVATLDLSTNDYLGCVPAFRAALGAALTLFPETEVFACLHDDLEIHDPGWAATVVRHFARTPACGLAGFGGAIGLGDADLYQKPYAPMQLARVGFRSNLVDAEVHGIRSLLPERVACLDGFSQIGRRDFWCGRHGNGTLDLPPWSVLDELGIVHHFYDSLLGAMAARYGWETWYLPVRARHLGGQTAVADRHYQEWADRQVDGGDQAFWRHSHQIGYEEFRDILPLRV